MPGLDDFLSFFFGEDTGVCTFKTGLSMTGLLCTGRGGMLWFSAGRGEGGSSCWLAGLRSREDEGLRHFGEGGEARELSGVSSGERVGSSGAGMSTLW